MTGYSEEHGKDRKRSVNDFYREKPSVKFLLLKNAQAALFNTAIADKFDENAKERCDKNLEAQERKNVAERNQTEKEENETEKNDDFGSVVRCLGSPTLALFPKLWKGFFSLGCDESFGVDGIVGLPRSFPGELLKKQIVVTALNF